MKKHFAGLLLAVFLGFSASAYADIRDNFATSGISFSGGTTFNFNLGNFMKAANEYQYFSLSLYPGISYFISDGFDLSLWPSFWYSSSQTNLKNVDNSMNIGLSVGVGYYLSESASGPGSVVTYIGANGGITYYPAVSDIANGSATTSKSSYQYYNFSPNVAVLYFLTERIALRFGSSVSISAWSWLTDTSGNTSQDTTPFTDKITMNTSSSIGITFFQPRIDKVLFLQ